MLYHKEMSECMKILDMTPVTKKQARHSAKPYWNESLTVCWKEAHVAEKTFIKTPKTDHGYLAIKSRFLHLQRHLDKEIKKAKRSHERSKIYQLEETNLSNPTEFWRQISKLGPKRDSKIPWEVDGPDGNIITDKNIVLNTWKQDFAGLLTPPQPTDPDQINLYENVKATYRDNENL